MDERLACTPPWPVSEWVTSMFRLRTPFHFSDGGGVPALDNALLRFIKHTDPYQAPRPLQILVGTSAILFTLRKYPPPDAKVPHLHRSAAIP